ncbi:hypothetical protein ACWCP6_02750 [Streptomyces sp. NPDC002004]
MRGSGRGTSGTCTRPAPSRLRPEEPDAEPELRTETERPDERPDSDRDSRPDTDLRDDDEREEGREPLRAEALLPDPCEPRDSLPPPVTPVGSAPTEPEGDTTGASPHVSQYSSPPPTSSYDPGHPGR